MLPKFDYVKPKTLKEAVDFLSLHGNEAKILAGGTDLLVLMRDEAVKPKYLVDIKAVKELNTISYEEDKGLTIGATVTLNEIIESDIIKERFGILHEATSSIADHEIRNRATLVGNICNASPAADTAPALLVLDAIVKVIGPEGERTIKIQDFFTGVKETSLKEEEFVKAVEIPNPPEGARGRYLKQQRIRSEDLAIVGVAALVTKNSAGKRQVRIAFSSVAPTPIRIFEVEEMFEKDRPISELIDEAVSVVSKRLSPISDVRGSREYRAHLIEVLTRRVLKELLKEGRN